MRNCYSLLFFAFLIILGSCDIREPQFDFFIINHSKDSVYVSWDRNDEYLPSMQPNIFMTRLLAPGEQSKWSFYWNWSWKEHSMAIWFIKAETVNTLSWPVVQERDTIDCVKFYSLDDLKAANYMIEYK